MHAGGVVHLHALVDRHHRGGRAGHRHQPLGCEARPAQLVEVGAHPLLHPRAGPFELAGAGRIGREELLRHATASDVEGVRAIGPAARAPGDDLGRAAADVHHEQALPPEVARRAREGEGRLALAGDDGQRDAQARHQRLELVGVARVARGRRGHGPRRDGGMFRRGEPAQHVEEARHGIGHALHGRGLQHARRVHALAEVRDGVLAVELMEPPRLVHVGHEHAARHGADVDGRVSARLETAFGTLGLRDGAHGDPFPRSTRRRTGRPGTASTTSPAPRRCPA